MRAKLGNWLDRLPPERRCRLIGFLIGAPVGFAVGLLSWWVRLR